MKGKTCTEDYKTLYRTAKEIGERAYAPFSGFHVGAALLTKEGRVFTGVNVENSSYGATICAERAAFVKAITEGMREFAAIAVCGGGGAAWPCGICRQFMAEFCSSDFEIITGDDEENLVVRSLSELLPEGFKLQ